LSVDEGVTDPWRYFFEFADDASAMHSERRCCTMYNNGIGEG
jgi:hypothetical protein